MQKSSSFAHQAFLGAGTTSTGLNTDGRPSGALLSGSGAQRGALGTTVRDSGTQQAMAFSGFGG